MDKSDRKKLQQYITEKYTGLRLRDVRLYVGSYKVPFENKQGWHLCDVAVEFEFDEDSIFTFCFDPEWELLDFFDKSYVEMVPETQTKMFRQSQHGLWQPFVGNTLENIDIHWNWYQDFDENTYYIPQVIKFEFVDDKKFIVAGVNVGVDKGDIVLNLDSEGDIIVGFTEEIWSIITDEILRQDQHNK